MTHIGFTDFSPLYGEPTLSVRFRRTASGYYSVLFDFSVSPCCISLTKDDAETLPDCSATLNISAGDFLFVFISAYEDQLSARVRRSPCADLLSFTATDASYTAGRVGVVNNNCPAIMVNWLDVSAPRAGAIAITSQAVVTDWCGDKSASESIAKAFDCDLSTQWVHCDSLPHHVSLDMGESVFLSHIRLFHTSWKALTPDFNTKAFRIYTKRAEGDAWSKDFDVINPPAIGANTLVYNLSLIHISEPTRPY